MTEPDLRRHYRELVAAGFAVSQAGELVTEDGFVGLGAGAHVDLRRRRGDGTWVTYVGVQIMPAQADTEYVA